MTARELKLRAAQLLAADMDPEAVASFLGVGEVRVLHWLDSRTFQREVYLQLIAHNSMLEANLITARKARGILPAPAILQDLEPDDAEACS